MSQSGKLFHPGIMTFWDAYIYFVTSLPLVLLLGITLACHSTTRFSGSYYSNRTIIPSMNTAFVLLSLPIPCLGRIFCCPGAFPLLSLHSGSNGWRPMDEVEELICLWSINTSIILELTVCNSEHKGFSNVRSGAMGIVGSITVTPVNIVDNVGIIGGRMVTFAHGISYILP
ncbi:uncharacterized protein EDB91DRAFT_1087576 [Suillus paluster]|uniref:uncharacterized protein n=1 Tax=Suillus paluster TaxID=48578 RepID=UPI001B85F66A|nr:uncharacterized protein EDB91DRAFT_1087576 [Suillus paluster]KAG1724157.1 hypothetical protein EDB91DRAFT_1087576 [Suillus paluster]